MEVIFSTYGKWSNGFPLSNKHLLSNICHPLHFSFYIRCTSLIKAQLTCPIWQPWSHLAEQSLLCYTWQWYNLVSNVAAAVLESIALPPYKCYQSSFVIINLPKYFCVYKIILISLSVKRTFPRNLSIIFNKSFPIVLSCNRGGNQEVLIVKMTF